MKSKIDKKLIIAVLTFFAAVIMWYVKFVVKPYNFWLMMSCTTFVLLILAVTVNYPVIKREELNLRNLAIGVVSALVLYFIFWVGNYAVKYIMPDRISQIHAVYGTRSELSPVFIALLLFFPIGIGEEVFWRGFLQKHLDTVTTRKISFLIILAAYTSVHLSSGNFILILASFVCGLFWGCLYYKTGSIVPGTISHMLWDPLIFVIFPLM